MIPFIDLQAQRARLGQPLEDAIQAAERVRAAVTNSGAVAEAYLHEHQQAIRADILAIAAAINRDGSLVVGDADRLSQTLREQAEKFRNLTAYVDRMMLQYYPDFAWMALRQAA